MIRGALFKQRGFSESLVATVPYILLSLAVAVGFKSGLFNIGAEGQFYIGAIGAAWAGVAFSGLGLPAIVHLPLTLGVGAMGGAIWAAIAGFLKAKTGAHEVITHHDDELYRFPACRNSWSAGRCAIRAQV